MTTPQAGKAPETTKPVPVPVPVTTPLPNHTPTPVINSMRRSSLTDAYQIDPAKLSPENQSLLEHWSGTSGVLTRLDRVFNQQIDETGKPFAPKDDSAYPYLNAAYKSKRF